MRKKLVKFIASASIAVLTLAGCQAVGNINLNEMLLKNLEMKSSESTQSITLDLLIDETKVSDPEVLRLLQLFDPLTIETHTIYQDQENLSIEGNVILNKGNIPFRVSIQENVLNIKLDNAWKPIRIEMDELGVDRSIQEDYVKQLAPVLVRNLPNPNTISVQSETKTIQDEVVNGNTVHAEIYGTEIPDLVFTFVKNIANDLAGLEQIVTLINNMEGIEPDDEDFFSATQLQEELQQEIAEFEPQLEELKNENFIDDNTYVKTDIFLDYLLQQRKSSTEIMIVVPEEFQEDMEGFAGVQILIESEMWNVNQPLKANTIKSRLYVTPDELVNVESFYDTLDNKEESVLYDVLVNDLHLTRNEIILTLDEPDAFINDDYFYLKEAPYSKDGRALAPLTDLTYGLDSAYEWNADTREVTVFDGDTRIVFKDGSHTAIVNGEEVSLEVAAENKSGTFMVPVVFISKQLKAEVTYDAEYESITIVQD